MRKEALILSAVLLLAGSVTANEVYYEMDAGSENIMMNTTVKLDCEGQCPHNWRLRWTVPEDGKLLGIEGEQGPITDYTVEDGGISVTSQEDNERDPETFKMRFRIDRPAEEVHNGLYKREFSLRSFKGAETTGKVHVDNFLSGWTGYGVETYIDGNNLSFRADNPINLRVKFGKGNETRYYEFFGGDPENISMAFEVPVGTTGEQFKFKKLPVAILPSGKFNETVSPWSAGEYYSGSALLREGLKDSFVPILAHETVHALNDRKLQWDKTSSAFFEEGTSSYIEFLVRNKLYSTGKIDKPPAELFGNSRRFDLDPTDNYYSTIPPKGSADFLWGYYQNNRSFMKTWNPFNSPPEYREFGYAYSELVIRNYVVHHNGSLRTLYNDLDVDRKVQSPEEKWSIFSQYLDMTPCKYETREKFNRCLKEIRNYNYKIYRAEPTDTNGTKFQVKELEIPEREVKQTNKTSGGLELDLKRPQTETVLENLLDSLDRFYRQALIFLQTSLN